MLVMRMYIAKQYICLHLLMFSPTTVAIAIHNYSLVSRRSATLEVPSTTSYGEHTICSARHDISTRYHQLVTANKYSSIPAYPRHKISSSKSSINPPIYSSWLARPSKFKIIRAASICHSREHLNESTRHSLRDIRLTPSRHEIPS